VSAVGCDPNGVIIKAKVQSDLDTIIKVPEDKYLTSRYLLGDHVVLGKADVDHDGSSESINLCAKYITTHRISGGKRGSTRYMVTHLDKETNDWYISTFPVSVNKSRPVWRSKAMGFNLWAIIGSILFMIMVQGLIMRRNRLNKQAMIVFKNYHIRPRKKDKP
jgi:hypothetical protein